MRFVFFCHSLISDWNHGNAHFLRGVVRELVAHGHDVRVFEPARGWSRCNLIADHGPAVLKRLKTALPEGVTPRLYEPASLDLDEALDGAEAVLVHEWTAPELIARIGRHRIAVGRYTLFFHDTHHRSASAPHEIDTLNLDGYDGVLAFGEIVREIYLARGWTRRAWTWHEAADTALFYPLATRRPERDVVWIGNWGDEERSAELREYLLNPIQELGLKATVHGVRYPEGALREIGQAGAEYRGYLPNHEVPRVFARHAATVHVPRRYYARLLPGIPTIRVFEALAYGIPLVSAPWRDSEGLFRAGQDFLVARSGEEMKRRLRDVLNDRDLAASLRRNGLAAIRGRHTCAHRVHQLLSLVAKLRRESNRPGVRAEMAR